MMQISDASTRSISDIPVTLVSWHFEGEASALAWMLQRHSVARPCVIIMFSILRSLNGTVLCCFVALDPLFAAFLSVLVLWEFPCPEESRFLGADFSAAPPLRQLPKLDATGRMQRVNQVSS